MLNKARSSGKAESQVGMLQRRALRIIAGFRV